MLSKHKHIKHLPAFTLLELMITITVIAVLAGIITLAFTTTQKSTRDSARDAQVRILTDALEKYYRTNGEYPSVALMTGSSVDMLKARLGISDPTVFKLPNAQGSTSLATANPSPTNLVYAANTSDATKNTQCQTDVNGYCDGFTLQYVKESSGATITITSLKTTFVAVKDSSTCDAGDAQSGNTCTHTYAATYQSGGYSCPSGGVLSGTTCTNSYSASYSPGGGYYYCPSGGSLSGTTCTTTSSYAASGGTMTCKQWDILANGTKTCSSWSTTPYSCPSGGSLSGSTCTTTSSYGATYTTYSGYYYCSGSGTLSGTTCTNTYTATQGSGYYACPSGGTVSGTTCSYTYTLT